MTDGPTLATFRIMAGMRLTGALCDVTGYVLAVDENDAAERVKEHIRRCGIVATDYVTARPHVRKKEVLIIHMRNGARFEFNPIRDRDDPVAKPVVKSPQQTGTSGYVPKADKDAFSQLPGMGEVKDAGPTTHTLKQKESKDDDSSEETTTVH